jgi:fused signal recognition particle receptor
MAGLKEWLFGSKPGTAQAETPHRASKDAAESDSPFARLRAAVANTGRVLFGALLGEDPLDAMHFRLDEDRLDDLEETLLRADVGVKTTGRIVERIRGRRNAIQSPEALISSLQDEFTRILCPTGDEQANRLNIQPGRMTIVLIVGVNGSGKTTTIGKLAHRYKDDEGRKVIIGAADTFRAAADDQLAVWAERAGAEIVRKPAGTDPSAVVFETLSRAKEIGAEVVIIDTAGRLQNKFNLMEELKKLTRILDRERPEGSAVESLLVIDATTGQNALQQAAVFKEAAGLTGVVLTKLDGSAKGGVVLAVTEEHGLPVKLVGVGERIADLQDFSPRAFVDALFGTR